jgi:hypothetical protein
MKKEHTNDDHRSDQNRTLDDEQAVNQDAQLDAFGQGLAGIIKRLSKSWPGLLPCRGQTA